MIRKLIYSEYREHPFDIKKQHVEDVVAVGDPIFVMVTDIDQQGRINLSRKDAIAAIDKQNYGQAREILIAAEQEAEERYLQQTDNDV